MTLYGARAIKPAMKSWYGFRKGGADGHRDLRDVLGGKGANLAEMCKLDIPVPPGFTLPTSFCTTYGDASGRLSSELKSAIREGVHFVEEHMHGPRLGDPQTPLLMSVRSGARESMPGMMDTVLNLGLTESTLDGLARSAGSRCFALDSYRRLIQMYGDVVRGVSKELLHKPLEKKKEERGVRFDHELDENDLASLVDELLDVYQQQTSSKFPTDPYSQLEEAVGAVFRSWGGKRAVTYRNLHKIPHTWGTAANVQAMVFGNFGGKSGTGVAFSRDPSTGLRHSLGEWLLNAQGEDVVAGIRTPGPIHRSDVQGDSSIVGSLEDSLPESYRELLQLMDKLELHFKDCQDIEFTIQEGRLFLLQTRKAKRTATAALRMAVDMVNEKLIDKGEAVRRVTPSQIDQLLHPQIDPHAKKQRLAKGLPASPGAASGRLAFSAEDAEERAKKGEAIILVRQETSPEDIGGMHVARGVLTATGGMTSHAAVVARGMGRTCVVGCQALRIDEAAQTLSIKGTDGDYQLGREDSITLDGSTGDVYLGVVPTVTPELGGQLNVFLSWADELRTLKVRANADTPEDAVQAVKLGAEGIGLCRTEHMFFHPERLRVVREMILADTGDLRRNALARLEPMQRADFVGIFKAMGGRPVTIRFLDPPLHEFLPQTPEDIAALAIEMGVTPDVLEQKNESLHEFNPMLGLRGCRLGITYPEIYDMQARAVLNAACDVKEQKIDVHVEIMIPLVMVPEELRRTREQIRVVADMIMKQRNTTLPLSIGTMIELPRAALVADAIAEHADFFSFGTNDLTQTTLGLSRDDSGRFLPYYVENGILAKDPFASLDQGGVGKLIQWAIKNGRRVKADLKIGVCGEHGGDPSSIMFFAENQFDYVSCSPYRVPVARVAAAHAQLQGNKSWD